jgi:hypothetical protein
VNPRKKSDYHVEKWRVSEQFTSVEQFETKLKERFDKLKGNLSFGYIEPGHGLKGRQQWIMDDHDILDMYKVYMGKKEIIIWCHVFVEQAEKKRGKRQNNEAAACTSTSKRAKCAEKNEEALKEAETIMSQLQSKHGSMYSPEQYHAWAQLIGIKKHKSLDVPPQYTFFQGKKSKTTTASVTASNSPSKNSSPSKRIHARSELLNQLAKISDLLQKGYISEERYEKLQHDILEDMDTF